MDKDEMTLLGKMVRIHLLDATPILHDKPPPRWGLIFVVVILAMLVYIACFK
jgi:hypothetical protein